MLLFRGIIMKYLVILVVAVSCVLLGYFFGQKGSLKGTKYIKFTVNVPLSHADRVRNAIGVVGGGNISGYTHCSFSVKGTGKCKPSVENNPVLR